MLAFLNHACYIGEVKATSQEREITIMTKLTVDQIKGSFVDAIELIKESSLQDVTPLDMRSEIQLALSGLDLTSQEPTIYYASYAYEGDAEATHFALFPEAGRGGACSGGYTEWYDATTMDEIETQHRATNE